MSSKFAPLFFILQFAAFYLGSAAFDSLKAAETHLLWQIGTVDTNDSEFALAHGDYQDFTEKFGGPDHAFYVGLSNPQTDWPCVLPGLADSWGDSYSRPHTYRIEWNRMNTLPIGFVLNQASTNGSCVFTINFCDVAPKNPPQLRVTVNGAIFERKLMRGGSANSLGGNLTRAKPQTIRVEFPSSLLKPGYNEIALRITRGSWCLFDALRLETPADATLAPASATVIRSVSAPPYAVSSRHKTPATIRVELYQGGSGGNLEAQIGNEKPQNVALQRGLQALEIPAPASKKGRTTHIRLSTDGQTLYEGDLALRTCPPVTPADYVDVFMGTAHSRWIIAPGPWMPNSMVKISPDNQEETWCGGYEYSYEYINCFSQIHEWTMAGLGMMPTVGPLRTHSGLDDGYSSRFDKSTEQGGIGYYDVFLKDSGIKVELTATTRASLQRYTYPASDQARIMMPFLLPNEYEMHVLSAKVYRTGSNEIEGDIETDVPHIALGWVYKGDNHYILHFVSQFDHPFEAMGGWQNVGGSNVIIKIGYTRPAEELKPDWHGGEVFSNVQELTMSGDCGAFVNFKTSAGETIEVRTGISLVSVADARQNLKKEMSKPFGWDFAAVMQNQRRVWNRIFDSVEIETPNVREKTRFYSNLYRALSGRNTWSDVNGQWIDPYGRLQKLNDPANVMLGSDAFWNTFWNLNQVMNLLAPEWSARWVKSELQLYDKCGWLSKGPAGLKYLSIMVGEHEIPLMVAAYQAGITGLDPETILAAAVKMQTAMPQNTPNGGRVGNDNLAGYLKYGYVPADGPLKGHTSNTYEIAYDDWTVAQLALALGDEDLAKKFLARSQSWRNVFNKETGYATARQADGEWVSPFDPYHAEGFTEGTPWQYTWFVPQDVPGLIDAMGRDRFISRLNQGFEQAVASRFCSHSVDQDNEQDMQLSWLFNWAGEPWLTQKWTRDVLDSYYGYNPADAYLGDEDQGQMASWFVMCAMGLFQTDGGCDPNPYYEIASPLYPKITIHLSKKYFHGKTFTIEARNASLENKYIQSATLNGKPLNQWWIPQRDVIKGGTLVLDLGPEPNKDWAKECPLPNP